MKRVFTAMLALGAVAFAAPASAQLVNGLAGPDYHGEAPIGTKGGGSPSSLKAPGEAAALAGALRNEREAKGLRPGMMQAKVTLTEKRKIALESPSPRTFGLNASSQRLKTGTE